MMTIEYLCSYVDALIKIIDIIIKAKYYDFKPDEVIKGAHLLAKMNLMHERLTF